VLLPLLAGRALLCGPELYALFAGQRLLLLLLLGLLRLLLWCWGWGWGWLHHLRWSCGSLGSRC
jgi:hypothetical protein